MKNKKELGAPSAGDLAAVGRKALSDEELESVAGGYKEGDHWSYSEIYCTHCGQYSLTIEYFKNMGYTRVFREYCTNPLCGYVNNDTNALNGLH